MWYNNIMAYEKDYRKRILGFYYENGKTKTLLQFRISSSTLYGWIKLHNETGFDEYYYRKYSWSKRGISIEGRKSGLRYSRINLVARKIGNALIGSINDGK